MIVILKSWRELMTKLPEMDEVTLRESINYEASVYKRKAFITRMHQRYCRLRADRERQQLLVGEILL
jgi:hypothetical protein